ncbi:MAG: DUF4350 domain-containing protein [Fuerstiella sp.]|nr:DUF4350 domain-containing protein [Fuerstiella sp.]MCP4854941.1 DUF4350 domain-containing protein [Fuerstiella sp.]
MSVRNAIVAATVLLVLSIMTSLLSMIREPDSGGMGNDSFGTQGHGYRGLFETLDELGIEVDREFAPPDSARLTAGTVAFLNPAATIVATEPTYLTALQRWVNKGGRIVVALSAPNDFRLKKMLAQLKETPPTFLDAIDLQGVSLIDDGAAVRRRIARRPRSGNSSRDAETIAGDLLDALNAPLRPLQDVTVTVEGNFKELDGVVSQLTVPADGVASLVCDQPPDGSVTWTVGDEVRILAARFKRGEGEIVVISDPLLLTNRLIARGDNSILAARLLAPSGKPVLFDEFYHGLGVRGQPLYLLTHLSYASAAVGILTVLGLSTWRKAVFPGPPLPDDRVRRRDIREYVDAMARFFSEGNRGRGQLVQELRNGVLRQLSIEMGLPHDTTNVDKIATVMARKEPQRAKLLRDATQSVNRATQSARRWSQSETLDAMRRMSACL